MRIPLLGALPFDPSVVEGGDKGHPVLEDSRETPFKKAVTEFAAAVLERVGPLESGLGEALEKTVH